MHIFCDESGGTDQANGTFIVSAVAVAQSDAKVLMRRFRKATRIGDEIKGHRLTPEQRRIFFRELRKMGTAVAVSTTCSRQHPLGGWAMATLDEADLRTELLVESCAELPIVGPTIGITVDGGRYKRQVLERLVPMTIGALEARFAGMGFTMQYDSSERVAGLQVADIIANTLFHSLGDGPSAEDAATQIHAAEEVGQLIVRLAELTKHRPVWLAPQS